MAHLVRASGRAALSGADRPAEFPGSPRDARELAALLDGPPERAAQGLLGCLLTVGEVTVRLTEVEAYSGVGTDPASHAHRGRTARNAVMFGPAGYTYVYFTYGMHFCVNVVCGPVGTANAVLLRAGEVVVGYDVARARRPGVSDRDLARGPARLTRTLGLDRAADGTPLLDGTGPARLAPGAPVAASAVRSGPRVGVSSAAETPWRFWLAAPSGGPEPTVSAYRAHTPRVRRR